MCTQVRRLTVFFWFAVAFLVLVYLPARIAEEMSQPPANVALDRFSQFLPAPSDVAIIEYKGQKYVIVLGKQYFPLEYAAGYIFNASGKLVDWSAEAADCDRLAEFWVAARNEIRTNGSIGYGLALRRLQPANTPQANGYSPHKNEF